MIISSFRARIAKDPRGAMEFAQEIAGFVREKTGNEIEVLARVGATQDIVWLQRFPDLAAYEKSVEVVQSDPEYWAKVKQAESKGLFDASSMSTGDSCVRREPPDAERHVRWCGSWGG
jgi:hypothetical protein